MASTDKDLYRSRKKNNWGGKSQAKNESSFESESGKGSLYPDYEGYVKKNGDIRPPDVITFKDKNGIEWIYGISDKDSNGKFIHRKTAGVSISSNAGGFGYGLWFYFLLPSGTNIPENLDVIPSPGGDPGHHSIRCKNQMTKTAYEAALNNMARSAIQKAVETKRKSLYFS